MLESLLFYATHHASYIYYDRLRNQELFVVELYMPMGVPLRLVTLGHSQHPFTDVGQCHLLSDGRKPYQIDLAPPL